MWERQHDRRCSGVAAAQAKCSRTYIGEKRAHCPAFIQAEAKEIHENVRGEYVVGVADDWQMFASYKLIF